MNVADDYARTSTYRSDDALPASERCVASRRPVQLSGDVSSARRPALAAAIVASAHLRDPWYAKQTSSCGKRRPFFIDEVPSPRSAPESTLANAATPYAVSSDIPPPARIVLAADWLIFSASPSRVIPPWLWKGSWRSKSCTRSRTLNAISGRTPFPPARRRARLTTLPS